MTDEPDFDIDAMRDFADILPDDLGPMFGRDVLRLIDAYERLQAVLYMPALPPRQEEPC